MKNDIKRYFLKLNLKEQTNIDNEDLVQKELVNKIVEKIFNELKKEITLSDFVSSDSFESFVENFNKVEMPSVWEEWFRYNLGTVSWNLSSGTLNDYYADYFYDYFSEYVFEKFEDKMQEYYDKLNYDLYSEVEFNLEKKLSDSLEKGELSEISWDIFEKIMDAIVDIANEKYDFYVQIIEDLYKEYAKEKGVDVEDLELSPSEVNSIYTIASEDVDWDISPKEVKNKLNL